MIKLETKTMTKAIARAKVVRPRVRVLSVAERTYSVMGSRGDVYTVRFAVANGMKLGECDCPARGMCYHLAAAAAVNIGIQSMRRPAPAVENGTTTVGEFSTDRATLITDIKRVWPKTWPPLYTELLARFGKSNLEMLDDDMLRRVRLAIAM